MERISRDTIALIHELKKELSTINIDKEEHLIFVFYQIGQLLDHAFSIHYIIKEKHYLRFKIWDVNIYKEGSKLGFF